VGWKKKTWFVRYGPFRVPVPINVRGLLFFVSSILALLLGGRFAFEKMLDGEMIFARFLYIVWGVAFVFYFIIAYKRSER